MRRIGVGITVATAASGYDKGISLGLGGNWRNAGLSTIAYTAFAGIKSDFYTDVIHFLVIFIVLLPVTISEIKKIYGYSLYT